MRAFHADPAIKEKYLVRVREHRAADQIIKGQYWEGGKGCAVGCTIHGSAHDRYETELGIPSILAHLEDGLFEALPNDVAIDWPEKFLDAVPVGADLSMVMPQFMYWLLSDENDGVIRLADETKFPSVRAAVQSVAALYARLIGGETVERQEWVDSRAAAYAADAADAAYAAADAAYAAADAADAAYAAAYAAYAAADAAYAAAYAADAADAASRRRVSEEARIHARVKQSEKLIELLKAAPIAPELVEA